jgi:Flp pilus assembly pilin Flp
MNAQWKRWIGLANDQRGGALVEYVIVVALVAAVAVGTWQTFGQSVKDNIDGANNTINGEIEKGGK